MSFMSTARVQLHETHTGLVLLCGERAYKVKKPITTDFLDFGTPALREQACARELELLTEIAAPEWELTSLVELLVRFHRLARPGPDVDRVGTTRELRERWQTLLRPLREEPACQVDQNLAERIDQLAMRYIDGQIPLFDRRNRRSAHRRWPWRRGTVRLALVGGLPGSGKSAVAPRLAAVYTELLDRARALLASGVSVILDASWIDYRQRDVAAELAANTHSDLVQLRCTCPRELAARRNRRRLPSLVRPSARRRARPVMSSPCRRSRRDRGSAGDRPRSTRIRIEGISRVSC